MRQCIQKPKRINLTNLSKTCRKFPKVSDLQMKILIFLLTIEIIC